MSHLTQEQKLGYIANRLDEEASFVADEHLATCPQCAGSVRALRTLRHNFDQVWDALTAASHAQAYWRDRLAATLKDAAEEAPTPALRERIQRWLDRVHGKAGAAAEVALNLILDSSRKVAQVASEGLEGLRQAGSALRFELVPSVATGRPGGVIGEPTEAAPDKITVKAERPPWAEVRVDSRIGKVSVLLELQKEPWPLVLLQPKETEQVPMIGEFRRPEGMGFLLAEFEEVPGGEYLLLMEPLS